MASGQAKGAVAAEPNDWKTVEPSDWQTVPATSGAAPDAPKMAKQGAFSSFADSSGLSGLKDLVTHPIDTISKIPSGLMSEAGRVGDQLKEAWNTPNNEPINAIDRTLYAIPFIGGSLKKADEQAAQGNYAGAAGTGAGVLGSTLMAGMGGDAALESIPSKARAGEVFDSIAKDAAGKPVTMSRSMPILERAQQLSERGHGTITPIDKLYQRANTINPIDYIEARDRASALSNITANDKMSATKSLSAQAKLLSRALNEDIGDTAASVGRGEDFNKAMKEYRRASMMSDAGNAVTKYIKKSAIPLAIGAGGYGLLKDLER